MADSYHGEVMKCVFTHCGIDLHTVEPETFQSVNLAVAQMHGAAHVWQKPSEIERELEDARTKLNEAIKAVQDLDNYAKALARKQAERKADEAFEMRILAVGQSDVSEDEKEQRLNEIVRDWQPTPQELWVDNFAIAAMSRLRDALKHPIEQAIPNVRLGAGRPPNRQAYAVAECAYRLFSELTGTKPTYWNGGETPFSRLVTGLYSAYGIESSLRKPIEAAMHKYGEKNRI
jgi:hypothetical protein